MEAGAGTLTDKTPVGSVERGVVEVWLRDLRPEVQALLMAAADNGPDPCECVHGGGPCDGCADLLAKARDFAKSVRKGGAA